jgi:hypothetical protein
MNFLVVLRVDSSHCRMNFPYLLLNAIGNSTNLDQTQVNENDAKEEIEKRDICFHTVASNFKGQCKNKNNERDGRQHDCNENLNAKRMIDFSNVVVEIIGKLDELLEFL